jgi:hypothetical protein
MALPPEQTGNTGTVDIGHARIDVTEGKVHVTDSANAYTEQANNTSPAEADLITHQLLQQVIFELKLSNRYSATILGEDLRECEELEWEQ